MSSPTFDHRHIKQGYCYVVDMDPPRRSKPGKVRPVVVIQATDTIAAGSPGIVIVPLTTKLRPENILRVRITGAATLLLSQPSDALVDQIHTIDRTLFLKELGVVASPQFTKIQTGVKFLLDLRT